MYEAPPPYPGIDPNLSAYPPAPQVNGHHPDAAAAAAESYPDGPQSAAAGMTYVIVILKLKLFDCGLKMLLSVECVCVLFKQGSHAYWKVLESVGF